MEVSVEELKGINEMVSERDVRIAQLELRCTAAEQRAEELEAERQAVTEMTERLQQRVAELEQLQTAKTLECMVLKNYILLSAERIKKFFGQLEGIDRWAFLRTFLEWSLPDELRKEEMPRIDELLALPDRVGPTVVNNTFAGDVGTAVTATNYKTRLF